MLLSGSNQVIKPSLKALLNPLPLPNLLNYQNLILALLTLVKERVLLIYDKKKRPIFYESEFYLD